MLFSVSGGSSQGTIGPTRDNGDGTYEADFTATAAGTTLTVGATINGSPVSSTLPTILVAVAGSEVCEAQGGASCWYVAANGSDSNPGTFAAPFRLPQTAVERAGPGDFIYLRGGAEFGLDHTVAGPNNAQTGTNERLIIDAGDGSPGQAGAIITLKSLPGEQAVIRGSESENIRVWVSQSYWRVEGLRIIYGNISVAERFRSGVHHVWIVGNHVSDYTVMSGSNWGLIKVDHANNAADDPHDIFIWDNVLHDLNSIVGANDNGPWDSNSDTEHHACFVVLRGAGLIEFAGNEAYNCPSFFYFKYVWDGPVVMRDNVFHHAQTMGQWRNGRNEFRNNIVHDVITMRSGVRTRGDSNTNVYVNNTFVGIDDIIEFDGPLAGHTVRDNVVFGAAFHSHGFSASGDFAGSDIDGNCVITPPSFAAVQNVGDGQMNDWDSYRATYGHDANGVRLVETNMNAVFANPASGDFTLIGTAASQCGGAGSTRGP